MLARRTPSLLWSGDVGVCVGPSSGAPAHTAPQLYGGGRDLTIPSCAAACVCARRVQDRAGHHPPPVHLQRPPDQLHRPQVRGENQVHLASSLGAPVCLGPVTGGPLLHALRVQPVVASTRNVWALCVPVLGHRHHPGLRAVLRSNPDGTYTGTFSLKTGVHEMLKTRADYEKVS